MCRKMSLIVVKFSRIAKEVVSNIAKEGGIPTAESHPFIDSLRPC